MSTISTQHLLRDFFLKGETVEGQQLIACAKIARGVVKDEVLKTRRHRIPCAPVDEILDTLPPCTRSEET